MTRERQIAIAERIKACREESGLSHKKLADLLGDKYGVRISDAALKNYEIADEHHTKFGAVKGMNISYLQSLSDCFGVSTDWLLGASDCKSIETNVQIACKTTGLKPHTINAIRRLTSIGKDDEGNTERTCIFPMYAVLGNIIEHKDFHLAMEKLYQLCNSILKNDAKYLLSDGITRNPELEAIGHYIEGKDVKQMYAVSAKEYINNAFQAFIGKFITE